MMQLRVNIPRTPLYPAESESVRYMLETIVGHTKPRMSHPIRHGRDAPMEAFNSLPTGRKHGFHARAILN